MLRTERDTSWFDNFEAAFNSATSILSQTEVDTIHDVQGELGNIAQEAWSPISDDLFPPKDKVHKDGDSVAIGRCVAVCRMDI